MRVEVWVPPEPALGVSATSGIRKTDSQGVKWGADGLIMPAILPAAVLSGSDAAGGSGRDDRYDDRIPVFRALAVRRRAANVRGRGFKSPPPLLIPQVKGLFRLRRRPFTYP